MFFVFFSSLEQVLAIEQVLNLPENFKVQRTWSQWFKGLKNRVFEKKYSLNSVQLLTPALLGALTSCLLLLIVRSRVNELKLSNQWVTYLANELKICNPDFL